MATRTQQPDTREGSDERRLGGVEAGKKGMMTVGVDERSVGGRSWISGPQTVLRSDRGKNRAAKTGYR